MKSQQNALFFEIQEIGKNSTVFDELINQELFFSYFLVNHKYYLFFYGQKYIDIDLIDPSIDILEELDRKERQIRSLRGFFLYALEIMEGGTEILKSNLKPSFWRRVKPILRQNKKAVLLEFLFGLEDDKISLTPTSEMIQNLQNQINSLHQRVIDLENQNRLETIQSENLLEANMGALSLLSQVEQSNVSSTQSKAVSGSNFRTFRSIPEEKKVEMIERGFRLNQEGKISLKKYYEGRGEYSLFQLRGYSIKYESIRRTKLYQQLKE